MAKPSKTGKNKSKKSRKRSSPTLAQRADRHALYELSVQDTDFEYEFVDKTFKQLRGRRARLLREDFCGTAQMCCEWVRHRKTNRAIGVDLDAEVLDWARGHNLAALRPGQAARVQLLQDDVLTVETESPDLVIAMNFSYQLFTERAALRRYFSRVREALVEDGVFIIDAFGGYDAFREMKEETEHEGFTYIWDQHRYDPVTGRMTCYIHFKFPDGSRLRRAFVYHWRLWTLPELRELLEEAGFSRTTVYWQGTDEEGEPDGIFLPAETGDADPAWIAFISAEK
ncbi:class I SAM-dependent methyltransferase [Thiohalobacter sp. IOR34]|uniref:class I SAM-dependent methyltransferase n=1 Tax=Thiohalobacter sp. IOR34 TaxID=3057176 RepID=UPI0025B0D5C0|nr:class I SAM-dependent methyltransferase [Thiohalobacter sp. IOR34]WJW74285.1 class I SAM-dependent methyltransferase [Thiohalobacter sp. IOR34]